MPVKPMCSRPRRTIAGPALTPVQLREILDRLDALQAQLRGLNNRVTALEVDSGVLAVAA